MSGLWVNVIFEQMSWLVSICIRFVFTWRHLCSVPIIRVFVRICQKLDIWFNMISLWWIIKSVDSSLMITQRFLFSNNYVDTYLMNYNRMNKIARQCHQCPIQEHEAYSNFSLYHYRYTYIYEHLLKGENGSQIYNTFNNYSCPWFITKLRDDEYTCT